jgi:multicomponent Na+:H+ antiporter subunit D
MPEEKTPLLGALNFAVSNTVGAFLSLTGVALLYARTGSLNMCEVGRSLISHNPGSHFLLITFLLVISGFLVKAAAFPFHFWLADAHAVAPTPVCILLSGVMVELGVYAVARLYWVIFQPPLGDHARGIQVIFIAIGCLGALTGGIFCFGQRHLKRLLAFSTISHVGLMFLGLGLMTTTALTGVAIYVIGHGMIKGALFVCAGVFLNRFGSVDEFDLRGRGRKVAPLAILMLLGAWGLAGLPPFGTFYGQLLIDHAAQRNGLEWLSIIIILAEALTAAAVLRATGRIFLGWGKVREATSRGSAHIKLMPETNTKSTSPRTPVSMWIPALLLLVVGMGLFTPIRVRAILHSRINAFQDGLSYQSAVLDGHSATSIAGPFTMNAAPSWQQLITLVATGLLALIALFPASIGRQANKSLGYLIARRMKQLRKLQSGRLGDYVAWLAFGVAAYGLTLLFFRKAG